MSFDNDIGEYESQNQIIDYDDHKCEELYDEVEYDLINTNKPISKLAICNHCKKTIRLK